MPIQPLGKKAALLLRASALVVTPASLVKELVDNAIDAKSTTIKVQIARNGVDQIEVQDNGVGIHVDDFGALGRRAHTSKLREFQDLPRVGGTSLGFRGEALAAANSFAEVIITTRTAGEKVGHRVRLEQKEGGVKKHDLVPAPVGTTVRIQHLFAGIPVRKRMAVENFLKSTAGIKLLLTAYALARPHIRISFCVLGDPRGSWSYSPVGAPNVREAVFQIFGNDLAPQCVGVTLIETTSAPHDKLIEELTDHEISRITDEVMFTDEPRVLKVIEELLDVSYALAEAESGPAGSDAGELDELTPEDLQALETFAIGDDNSSFLDPLSPSLDDSERDSEVVPFRNSKLGYPPDEGPASIYSGEGNIKPETFTPEADSPNPWTIAAKSAGAKQQHHFPKVNEGGPALDDSEMFNLIHIDSYISTGTSKTGLPDDLEEATDAQHRIQTVLGEWLLKTTGTCYDLKLNLRSQVKGKSSC
ncbi:uncharacterized protein DNG_00682 [Cephalotrichum gorgonifer]|uniref:Uncharacterized protein n=1 Tax=Cephalotrichum gorgonifer TaxID=2041049 RepID=A0AAE8SRG2_9PEZI|nr:uncharacterized protein DNG_00682 [Cephalotrichum gorgonifer]